jgi:hypothetical protein
MANRYYNISDPRGIVASSRTQRGSVFLQYYLLAFLIIVASAALVNVNKWFALLFPIGILVFLLPNLIAIFSWLQAGWLFRKNLSELKAGKSASVVVLKNEFGGLNSQAFWLDPSCRELGVISENDDGSARTLDTLNGVRAILAEESYAVSFHEGRIRIPQRYVLIFEFKDARQIELVTRKRRLINKWIEELRPYLGSRLSNMITKSP